MEEGGRKEGNKRNGARESEKDQERMGLWFFRCVAWLDDLGVLIVFESIFRGSRNQENCKKTQRWGRVGHDHSVGLPRFLTNLSDHFRRRWMRVRDPGLFQAVQWYLWNPCVSRRRG